MKLSNKFISRSNKVALWGMGLGVMLACAIAVQAQMLPGAQTSKQKGLAADLQGVGDYPQEALVLEQYTRAFRFESDGTGTATTVASYKVHSDAGVQALGVLQVPYNSLTDELKFDYVRVKKNDGAIINTPTENAQDSNNQVSQIAPMYTDMKIRYLPVVGLRPGDTLEWSITVTTKKPVVPNQFFLELNFEKDTITKNEVLEVNIPAARKIKLKNEPGATPEIKEADGRRIYTWHHNNLVRKEPKKKDDSEAGDEDDDDDKPVSVELTSFNSWEDVGTWYSALQSAKVNVTPEIKAKVTELTKGANTDEEKIARIYDFVAKEFRYIGLEFGVGRYQPHDAAEVFAARYGDCKDKHTLLAAMLKAAGYDAMPVLINSSKKLDTEVPSPEQFDHVISLVKLPNRDLWMDTTPELAPIGKLLTGLQKKNALLVLPAGSKVVETPASDPFPAQNSLNLDGEINDLGKLHSTIKQTWHGSDMEIVLRDAFRKTPEANWKELTQRLSYLGGWAGDVSDVHVGDPMATQQPFSYDYTYDREDFIDWKQTNGEMKIGLSTIAMPAPPKGTKAKVKGITLGGVGEFHGTAKVKLPAGTNAIPPEDLRLNNSFAEYYSSYRFQDGVFTADRRLVIKMREVPPSLEQEYEAFFRSMMEDQSKQANVWRKSGGLAEVPTSSSAKELEDAGENAIQQRDFDSAVKVFSRLTELEPRHQTAWASLGQAQMATLKVDEAIASFRKQMDVNPSHENAYLMLATALNSQKKYDESVAVLKKKLENDPQNSRAKLALASVYVDAGRPKEAVPYLEESLKDYPDDQNLELRLAQAYLDTGDLGKAIPAFDKLIAENPTPLMKNNVAYQISEKNVALDKAEGYAKAALASLKEHLQSVKLQDLSNDDLAQNNLQISTWDTMGWIYKQEGKLTEAESYIRSAWLARQDREIGDHLAEIYHLEGKADEEKDIREVASTLKAPPRNIAEALQRAKERAGPPKDEDAPPLLIRRGAGSQPQKTTKAASGKKTPTELLQDMRTVKLQRRLKQTVSAELFVMLSSGEKAADVKFIRGDAALKGWMDIFKSIDYRTEFPTDEKTKLIRRVVVSCSEYNGECMMVILPQETVLTAN